VLHPADFPVPAGKTRAGAPDGGGLNNSRTDFSAPPAFSNADGEKVLRRCVNFSRAWVDSFRKAEQNGMPLPMLAMETEMKTQRATRGGSGFTWVELFVVICVIAWLLAMLWLALAPAKRKSSEIGCVNNLKQIAIAFRIWEGDKGDKYPMQVSVTNGGAMELAIAGNVAGIFRTMSNELSTPKVLICPKDSKRIAATNFAGGFSHANISYFVGLDAEDSNPEMILSGDDNLEINGFHVRSGILNLSTNAAVEWTENERHGRPQQWSFRKQHFRIGNIGLTYGSVQTTTSAALQAAFRSSGTATNRLLIP
jgi:hypothetical protein